MKTSALLVCSQAILAAAVLTVLSSCAINPQTLLPNVPPSIQPLVNPIVGPITTNPNPCSNYDRNALGYAGGQLGTLLDRGNPGAGATLGAAMGSLVGQIIDVRRCRLYEIAQANRLRLASAKITPAELGVRTRHSNETIGLDVQLENKYDEFEPGSATLTPQGRAYLTQIAQIYTPAELSPSATPEQRQEVENQVILIVGHTDAQDAAAGANLAKLSQVRAKAVARLFAQAGVPAANIYYQGAGDALPIAPNSTAQGREANNRVQIVDVGSLAYLKRFLQRRSVNPMYYQVHVRPSAESISKAYSSATPATPATPIAYPQRASVAYQPPKHVAVVSRQPKQSFASCCNFGGTPFNPPGASIDLGEPIRHSIFSIIPFMPAARAAESLIVGSCMDDHPHPTTAVRNLKTGKELPPRDYVTGFYGTVWTSYVNGNLVALVGVKVPLDSGAPITRPTVYIYKNYHGNTHQAPAFKARAYVNIYRGTRKLLYRVFLHGPAKCLDLVVPARRFKGLGTIYYYNRSGDLYRATTQYAMQY